MDWIDAAAKLGFPVLSAIGLAWAFHQFILRREQDSAAREAALIAALTKERDFNGGKLVELIIGYAKDHADVAELLSRVEVYLRDAVANRRKPA